MNKNLYSAAMAVLLLTVIGACEKKGSQLPNEPLSDDPNVLGYSTARDSTKSYNTIWQVNLRGSYSTQFIFNNTTDVNVVGPHKVPNVTSGYTYHFGTRYFNNKGKLAYWGEHTERYLSTEVGLDMKEENCSGSVTDPVTDDIYLLMYGVKTSGARITYYYKVDKLLKASYELLPNASSYSEGAYTYYGGYNYIALTKTGPAAIKWVGFPSYTYIGFGTGMDSYPKDLYITIPGHTNFNVQSIYIDDNKTCYLFGHAINTTTKEKDAYVGRYNGEQDPDKVKMIPVTMPAKGYTVSQGVVKENKMYIPAYVDNDNKPAYFSFTLPYESAGSVVAEKTDLATDPATNRGHAVGLTLYNDKVYSCGQQGNFACYWKNEKLYYLDSAGLKTSYATSIYRPMIIIPPQ